MTRVEFEEMNFDDAMEILYSNSNVITTQDMLEEFVKHSVGKDNMLALHILEAVYNSEGTSEWFYYDYSAGTTCTPQIIKTADDVDILIGFDKE